MDSPSLTLRRADEREVECVETLLRRNDLPWADVSSKPDCFYVGYDDGDTPTPSDAVSGDTSTPSDAVSGDTSTPSDAVSGDISLPSDAASGDPVCVGGLERYGRTALLRSIVVEESARGKGYGSLLCDRLESRAAASGIEAVYLLTTTAADFFAGRGYERIERAEAPAAIRETAEFDELCPATATCMRTSL